MLTSPNISIFEDYSPHYTSSPVRFFPPLAVLCSLWDPAIETLNPNHWTAREFLNPALFKNRIILILGLSDISL